MPSAPGNADIHKEMLENPKFVLGDGCTLMSCCCVSGILRIPALDDSDDYGEQGLISCRRADTMCGIHLCGDLWLPLPICSTNNIVGCGYPCGTDPSKRAYNMESQCQCCDCSNKEGDGDCILGKCLFSASGWCCCTQVGCVPIGIPGICGAVCAFAKDYQMTWDNMAWPFGPSACFKGTSNMLCLSQIYALPCDEDHPCSVGLCNVWCIGGPAS